ncbi:asparaginase [Sphingobium sp. CR28]|uniref:asparaginase n=1 Tax=Sphingobium sp. CR28 TaxID=3400272 RepID=UPI003FEF1C32
MHDTAGQIIIIDAGGTISATPSTHGALGGGPGGDALLALLPEAVRGRCIVERAGIGLSEEMTLADAHRLVAMVEAACADPGTAGVAVAHGTDTMEEVAFLCDLLNGCDTPVVFTGAQRAPSVAGFDGGANLRDAIAVLGDPASRGAGTLIVFGGRIIAARHAAKVDSAAPDAFGPDWAVIGRVDPGRVRFFSRPLRALPLACAVLDGTVELAMIGIGTSGEAVSRLCAAPTRGLVLRALGQGNVPPGVLAAVRQARAQGVVILIATGAGAGGTGAAYDSGAELARMGCLFAGDLAARQARILLSVALGDARAPQEAEALLRGWLAVD